MASTTLDVHMPGRTRVEPPLTVRIIEPLGVELGGSPARFATRHAECAVYLLALRGSDGMMADDLGTRLWPQAPQHKRGPRVRTLLWQVRTALGDQAWRVQRRGPIVVLDLLGAELVTRPEVDVDVEPHVGVTDRELPDGSHVGEEALSSQLLRALAHRRRSRTSHGRATASSFR